MVIIYIIGYYKVFIKEKERERVDVKRIECKRLRRTNKEGQNKEAAIEQQVDDREEDLIWFFRSSVPGGRHKNKRHASSQTRSE
jgi:hypothetical protein